MRSDYDCGNGRILSTHDGEDNPFNELINQVRAAKRKGTVHRITFAEAVAAGLYRRVCLRKKKEWTPEGEAAWVADVRGFYADDADEELDVIPAKGGGTYLPLALIESRMATGVPIVRGKWDLAFNLLPLPVREAEIAEWCREHLEPILLKLDPERPHGFGQDFGRTGDLSVITCLEEGRDLVKRPVLVVDPIKRGRVQVVGAIAPATLDWLRTNKAVVPASAEIAVQDALIVGRKAERHLAAGDALTADEWRQLPAMLEVPDQVLYDTRTGKLLYVATVADPRLAKLAVEFDFKLKKGKGETNLIVSAFKLPREDIDGAVSGGLYEVVK